MSELTMQALNMYMVSDLFRSKQSYTPQLHQSAKQHFLFLNSEVRRMKVLCNLTHLVNVGAWFADGYGMLRGTRVLNK